MEKTNIPELFGSLVFDDREMRARLSEEIYTSLRRTIDENVRLDEKVAEAVADEMKKCVEKTGGAFYRQSDSFTVKDIVKDIQSQKVMEVNEITINKVVDKPAVPIWILSISIILIIITGALILL